MESRGQLRARKKQKAIADDAILSDHITDQLWPGMLLTNVPGLGKGLFVQNYSRGGDLLCDYNGHLLEGDEASAYLKRNESVLRHIISVQIQMLREFVHGGLAR